MSINDDLWNKAVNGEEELVNLSHLTNRQNAERELAGLERDELNPFYNSTARAEIIKKYAEQERHARNRENTSGGTN